MSSSTELTDAFSKITEHALVCFHEYAQIIAEAVFSSAKKNQHPLTVPAVQEPHI
jgi:hypothetical protein